ncbi:MAG: hypothetical protein K6G33_07235 [Ruminococcus sp.]|uniref:hypothetical protein n=1 Tax=Ruminococcus sp. TaxID=41978 RepID=UPI0025DA9453|nr:hypothetical protein [Ruminococcus sp.]MCR5600515.1 hypothetical protein [Ruminococcus sp.]
MKNVSKKLLCLLSSAILLCGASTMTASATPFPGDKIPGFANIKVAPSFQLNKTNVEITSSESVTLKVGTYVQAGKKNEIKLFKQITDEQKKKYAFQWYRDNTIIKGETEPTIEVTKAGKYFCRLYDLELLKKAGEFERFPKEPSKLRDSLYYDTDVAIVKVISDLTISRQPAGGFISDPRTGYMLSIAVNGGSAPYKYTWYRNGTEVGTGETYNAKEQGNYYCVVKDKKGRTVTSKTVYVSDFSLVKDLPTLANTRGNMEDSFTVEVSGGTGKYRYVWEYADIGQNNWKQYHSKISNKTSHTETLILEKYAGKKIRCTIYTLDENNNYLGAVTTSELNITEPLKSDDIDYYYGDNGKLYVREKITGGFGKYRFRGDVQITNWYETGTLEWWFDEETSILTYDNHGGSYSVHVWDEIGNHIRICPIN